MVPAIYDPDRIPLTHLLGSPTTGLAVLGTIAACLLLPPSSAILSVAALGIAVHLYGRRRRADRIFLARYFSMGPESLEIERTLRVVRELLVPVRGEPVPRALRSLADTFESLGDQAFHLGLAIRKLEGVRTLEDIGIELRDLDARLGSCQIIEERHHLHDARRHLMQERLDCQKVAALSRSFQAQLISIHHFFNSATTQIRGLSARLHVGSGMNPQDLVEESSSLLDTAHQVQDVIENLEGKSVGDLIAEAPRIEGVSEPVRCLLEASAPELFDAPTVATMSLVDILRPLKASLSNSTAEGRSGRIRIQKLIDGLRRNQLDSRRLCERLLDKARELNPRADSGLEPRILLIEAVLGVKQDDNLSSSEKKLLIRLGESIGIPREDLTRGNGESESDL